MHALNVIAMILLIAGALNWGLVGLARFNLVAWLFGSVPVLATIIYILVGLAGVYALVFFNWFACARHDREHGKPDHRHPVVHAT